MIGILKDVYRDFCREPLTTLGLLFLLILFSPLLLAVFLWSYLRQSGAERRRRRYDSLAEEATFKEWREMERHSATLRSYYLQLKQLEQSHASVRDELTTPPALEAAEAAYLQAVQALRRQYYGADLSAPAQLHAA
jgi:hypothetical protein